MYFRSLLLFVIATGLINRGECQSLQCPAVRTRSGWLDLFPIPCRKHSDCSIMGSQFLCCKEFCTQGIKAAAPLRNAEASSVVESISSTSTSTGTTSSTTLQTSTTPSTTTSTTPSTTTSTTPSTTTSTPPSTTTSTTPSTTTSTTPSTTTSTTPSTTTSTTPSTTTSTTPSTTTSTFTITTPTTTTSTTSSTTPSTTSSTTTTAITTTTTTPSTTSSTTTTTTTPKPTTTTTVQPRPFLQILPIQTTPTNTPAKIGKKQKLICPKTPVSVGIFAIPCETNSQCRTSSGPGQVCCQGICVKGVPAPRPTVAEQSHQPILGVIPRECPSTPLGELLFDVQSCKTDSDCWPRVCCPDGTGSYCRTARARLDLVPVANRIEAPVRMLESYLQCTAPPQFDAFPQSCSTSVDCFPNLCCAEGGKKHCRPPQRSLLALLASAAQRFG